MKLLPKSQVEFEITVAWKNWKKYLDLAATEASQEIKIEGFRPGKAPRKIVEQKVGKGTILNNAVEKAVKKSYVDFIKAKKLEVLGSPKVELLEAQEGKDLKYKGVVSVMPEIKIKDDYTEEIKKVNREFESKKGEIEEDELNLEIERLVASRVKLVTVNREARKGDSVEVDFKVLREGVPIENGSSQNHPIVLGKGVFIPGFEEQIVGMKAGEEKEFELTFPETYHQKNLAGQKATFKVKVNLVQKREVPEINDDFAKSLGNFENLVALKKSMADGMKKEKLQKIREDKRAKYLEEIIKKTEGELPDILIQEEIKRMEKELEAQVQPTGVNLDQYLAKLGKKREDLRKDWEPQAKKRVLSALILEKLAKIEGISASSKEIEVEVNKTFQYYKNVKDVEKNVDIKGLYNYNKVMLENEKVFEKLEKLK